MKQLTRRSFLGSSAAVPLGMGLPGSAFAQAELLGAATMIVTGANVITMDSDQTSAEALAVRGDRILAVGSNE